MGMDEILIEGKKYVSSKQATKLTGYAKDYIGQLCREGRVSARLVGRSWYVLETAIMDHRFGKKGDAAQTMEALPQTPSAKPIFSSAWEAPRYETSETESFPAVHEEQVNEQNISERLQDSWKEWFSRVADSKRGAPDTTEQGNGANDKENGEVPIPVHAIRHLAFAEPLPRISKDYYVSPEPVGTERGELRRTKKRSHGVGKTLRLAGILLALLAAGSAVIGIGYFDTYILSHNYIRAIAGIAVYNRP